MFHEDPDYDLIADFKPVVVLPEEVEVRTGEEGDTPLFSARCRLFRFTGGEWKERGVGELRVLHRQDGRVRVVMRRDQVRWDGRPFIGCPQDGFRMLIFTVKVAAHRGPFGARKVAEAGTPRSVASAWGIPFALWFVRLRDI